MNQIENRVIGQHTDYGSLADLLHRSGSPLPLAELHGGLCGVFCASGKSAASVWLDDLLDDCAGNAETLAELAAELDALGETTWRALTGLAMEFAPLLPGEDSAIDHRAEALGSWCHGFLAGLVVGGLDLTGNLQEWPDELNELVRDFAEISKAGVDSAELQDAETADSSFTELVEYVRVGAQLIFDELVTGERPRAERVIH